MAHKNTSDARKAKRREKREDYRRAKVLYRTTGIVQ